jgi:hypothetical protein
MVVLATVFWWMKPTQILTISKPLQVQGEEFHPGDPLTYKMSYCKFREGSAVVSISFVDAVSYSTPGMSMRELPLGCHTVEEEILVPRIPSGTYKLEMVRTYQVSPLQERQVRAFSQEFKVKYRMIASGTQMALHH